MQLVIGIIISTILFAIGHYLQTMTNRLGRKVFPLIKKCGDVVWICAAIWPFSFANIVEKKE